MSLYMTDPKVVVRGALKFPARLNYLLGRLHAYAQSAGDMEAVELVKLITKASSSDRALEHALLMAVGEK